MRQTQKFARIIMIRRIQLPGNLFDICFFLKRLEICALRCVPDRYTAILPRTPQTECIGCVGIRAGDHDVIRHRTDFIVIGIDNFEFAVLPRFAHFTAEADNDTLFGAREKPCAALFNPFVREFYLFAVDEFLLKKTVLVAKRIAIRGIIQVTERIHETSGKSPKTAVPESGVDLTCVDTVKRTAKALEHATKVIIDPQVLCVIEQ